MTEKAKYSTKYNKLTPLKLKVGNIIKPFKIWFGRRNKWQQFVLVLAFVIASLLSMSAISDRLWPPTNQPDYGTSFSIKYAEELGNDWRANYLALLDDIGFKRLRLMSYWDMYEKSPDVYDFSTLDWQMDEAAKHGTKVSLAIGLRQPRWPECHQPDWAKNLTYESDEWNAALNNYITTVQQRYKNHPALASYQLENEAKNSFFGDCPGKTASRQRLINEFNLAKANDPKHPVYMSLSDQHGFPAGQPTPDAYGFSVYRIYFNSQLPIKMYMTYPTPVWYHRTRAWLIDIVKGRPVFIHELQVEPWGPKSTQDLSITEQNRSMNPDQAKKNFLFARKIGKQGIYMWGSEWWYWRKTQFNDPSMWGTVKQEIKNFPQ